MNNLLLLPFRIGMLDLMWYQITSKLRGSLITIIWIRRRETCQICKMLALDREVILISFHWSIDKVEKQVWHINHEVFLFIDFGRWIETSTYHSRRVIVPTLRGRRLELTHCHTFSRTREKRARESERTRVRERERERVEPANARATSPPCVCAYVRALVSITGHARGGRAGSFARSLARWLAGLVTIMCSPRVVESRLAPAPEQEGRSCETTRGFTASTQPQHGAPLVPSGKKTA